MNICIFPGTFNPIHNAHLKMAEFALVKYGFDKVIFIPSYLPPHKDISKNLAAHRLNMVKLATASNPKFEVSDIEFKSEGKSYSLITVKKIIEKYKINGKLNFLIGTDAFANLDSWYEAEELKSLVHFIVFRRHGDNGRIPANTDFEFAEMDFVDISSTLIRKGFNDKNTSKLVEAYIDQNGLYKI